MPTVKTREDLLNDESVRGKIAEEAYLIAESHGFTPGTDHDNWLLAEKKVLAALLSEKAPKTTAKKVAEESAPTGKAKEAASANGGSKPKTAKTTKAAPAAEPTAKAKEAAPAKPAPAKRTTKKA